MKDLVLIAAALSDESRVRALAACLAGELCVCQITELLQLAPSTVSKHLSILKQAGLLESRKKGRWIYYRLAEQAAGPMQAVVSSVCGALKAHARAGEDRVRLQQILKIDPEELCLKQRPGSACCSSAPATPVEVRWRKGGRDTSKGTSSKRTRRAPGRRGSTRSRSA